MDGVVNNPPPPAMESIKDASIDTPKRNKYTVFVSCVISIKNFWNRSCLFDNTTRFLIMFELVSERIAQGFLSGIGLGALFYLYPVLKHILNDKYRKSFKISEFGEELFKIETIKYLRKGLIYGFLYGAIVGTVIGPFGAVLGI